MGKKSDYEKALTRLTNVGLSFPTITEAWEMIMEWLRGVPWEHMTPVNRERFWEQAIRPALENVFEELVERHVDKWRKYWTARRRWRPVYDRILSHLRKLAVDSPETFLSYMEDLKRPRMVISVYRDLASELGVSWRTVRDFFSLTRWGEIL